LDLSSLHAIHTIGYKKAKGNHIMRRPICTLLATCFFVSGASAQSSPYLTCQRLPTDICGGGGGGRDPGIPIPLLPEATGSAQWTYTPPNDGINLVSFNYQIPYLERMVWGGTCGMAPTRDIAVIVSSADLYSSITAHSVVPRTTYISASYMSYSAANTRSFALSKSVDTPALPNKFWTVVVREGRWGIHGEDPTTTWARNSAVCKLYVAGPPNVIYTPPTTVFGP
jgi:hypothetical protein